MNLSLTVLLLCEQSSVKATDIVIELRLINHTLHIDLFPPLAFRHV